MGKLKDFNIEIFDNTSLIYHGGQAVTGRVTFTLSEDKKCKGVSVTILGDGRVRWTESQGKTVLAYCDHETYLNERVVLYGPGPKASGNEVELSVGHHEYPFQFILPQNVPNSFKGAHGKIEYSLKAVIHKAWGFDDECIVPFQVIAILNLNNIHDAQMPVQNGGTKHFCCWCCKSGPLSAMVRLDRKCYTPGQHIPISAEITNLTDRNIRKTKASIVMHVNYHAKKRSKYSKKEIAHLERGPIKQGGSDYWNGELLEIPPTPPSTLEKYRIIDIWYTLNFSVCHRGAVDLVIPLEIIIGTQSVDSNFYPAFQ